MSPSQGSAKLPAKPPVEVDPRVELAAERTLLAWVRTGVAMMGFGFVVARFGLFIRELAAIGHLQINSLASGGGSLWIGTALVVLGALTNIGATWEFVRINRALRSGEGYPSSRFPLAVVLAFGLAVVGLAMSGYLLFVDHSEPVVPASQTVPRNAPLPAPAR